MNCTTSFCAGLLGAIFNTALAPTSLAQLLVAIFSNILPLAPPQPKPSGE